MIISLYMVLWSHKRRRRLQANWKNDNPNQVTHQPSTQWNGLNRILRTMGFRHMGNCNRSNHHHNWTPHIDRVEDETKKESACQPDCWSFQEKPTGTHKRHKSWTCSTGASRTQAGGNTHYQRLKNNVLTVHHKQYSSSVPSGNVETTYVVD